MTTTTTTITGMTGGATPVPAKFKVGDAVVAAPSKAAGTVTRAKWQTSEWVYEVRYAVGGALCTWFESQLKAGKGGAA